MLGVGRSRYRPGEDAGPVGSSPSHLQPVASNFKMFMVVVGLMGIAVPSALAFAVWIGVFKSIQICEKRFEGGTLFYLDYLGHIKNVGSKFQTICSDSTKVFGKVGDGVCPTGIYYDDPNSLQNPNLLRACAGLMVKPELLNPKVENQLTTLGYKKAVLPTAGSIYGQFPAKMGLSCVLGAMKFYPRMQTYVAEHPEKFSQMDMSQDGGSIEVIEGGRIHYYFPYEKYKEFRFSPFPRPELKEHLKKAT